MMIRIILLAAWMCIFIAVAAQINTPAVSFDPIDDATIDRIAGSRLLRPVDAAGNIFIEDNSRVSRVSPNGVAMVIAGDGGPAFVDGHAATATFGEKLYQPVIPAAGTGLQGVYYNGNDLSGTVLLTRVDPVINFELTYSKQPLVLSPAPGIVPEDHYSVRWTGQVQPLYSETYTFYMQSDDGVRLWVNGVKLVDNWVNQGTTEKIGSITLVSGQKYNITIEYYENTGEAVTKLYWSSSSTAKAIIPQSQLYLSAAISGYNAETEALRSFINTNGSLVPAIAVTGLVITLGTSTPTLTGGSVSRGDSRIRYIGGHTLENFDNIQPGNYPKNLFTTTKNLSFSSTERIAVGSIVEFDITCPKFEILEYENGGGVRVLVDNKIAGGYSYRAIGELNYRLFDFTAINANPVQRHIRLEYSNRATMGGLTLGTTGALLPLQDVVSYSICWLGDSFTEGTGVGSNQLIHAGLPAYASKKIGFRDYRMSGFGGTGYNTTCVTSFSSIRPSLADRINYDGINANVYVIAMGLNDRETDTALAEKITSTFDNLRATNPASLIFVLGPFGNGMGNNIKPNVENKIITAAANRPGVKFISIYDIAFTKSDATHPNAAGHVTLGTTIAERIKAMVAAADTSVQTPVIGTGTGLKGLYLYYDPNLGTLLDTSLSNVYLERLDSTINFEFTYSKQPLILSPAPGIVPEDHYSVRWTGQVQALYSEIYTFFSLSDDGVRLWVNGIKLVDNWVNQGTTEKSGSITLVAGQKYNIVMEYYENAGEAVTKLYWSSASTVKSIVPKLQLYPPVLPAAGTGLQGVYYNGNDLSGTVLLTRVDPVINFELTYSKQPLVLSPAPGIVPEDHYSVRWTGQVEPLFSETYTFYMLSDDGVRLWVNGLKLVDNWVNQGATEKSGSITLVAGQKYTIVIEYYENTGEAVTQLYWSSNGTAKAIIPKTQLFPAAGNARLTHGHADGRVLQAAGLASATTTILLSPNPVKRGQPVRLQINSNSNCGRVISVLGSNGYRISSQSIRLVTGMNTLIINTNALVQGVYIITLTGTNKPVTMKMIVD